MSIEDFKKLNQTDIDSIPDPSRSHEAVMQDFEKFNMQKTKDFKDILGEKDFEKAKDWLMFIENNRTHFSQYNDSWFRDRRKEIEVAEQNPDKVWNPSQTKKEAQKFLNDKFGITTTGDFIMELQSDLTKAEEWLNYIIDNSNDFPQYHATWDSWIQDRKKELKEAKNE